MNSVLIGPFSQLISMRNLPLKGPLVDEQLEILEGAGMWVENGIIKEVANFELLKSKLENTSTRIMQLDGHHVCMPSFTDCHTHILFGGERANDFAMRNAGKSYLDIAAAGGGIWNTVQATRKLSRLDLVRLALERSYALLKQGVTTIEIKSGYGLNVEEELKALRAIKEANEKSKVDLIATCLAAHLLPKDFQGGADAYLEMMSNQLFPILKAEKLTNRIDAFIEKGAFSSDEIRPYFEKAKLEGFDIVVHGDQFFCEGSSIAVEFDAISVDHLEASTNHEIDRLAQSNVVAVALPAASFGLGCSFAPARRLLDAGVCLAIATDWNPGSAPLGELITSASILGTMEKLSNAEVLAGITFRAAHALKLSDRGRLQEGFNADFLIYNVSNYQEITYQQGRLQPLSVWKNGEEIYHQY